MDSEYLNIYFQCTQQFCRPFAFSIDSIRCPQNYFTCMVPVSHISLDGIFLKLFFFIWFSILSIRADVLMGGENRNWDVSILSFLFVGTQIKEYLWWNSFIKHFFPPDFHLFRKFLVLFFLLLCSFVRTTKKSVRTRNGIQISC